MISSSTLVNSLFPDRLNPSHPSTCASNRLYSPFFMCFSPTFIGFEELTVAGFEDKFEDKAHLEDAQRTLGTGRSSFRPPFDGSDATFIQKQNVLRENASPSEMEDQNKEFHHPDFAGSDISSDCETQIKKVSRVTFLKSSYKAETISKLNPQIEHIQTAFLPSFGLSAEDIQARRIDLLRRKVDSWVINPKDRPKQRRELRMLVKQ